MESGRGVSKIEIFAVAKLYEKNSIEILECNDTSKGNDDIRLNYVILDTATGKKYVLKMNSSPVITESFISNMDSIAKRYRAIGVWTPAMEKSVNNRFVENVIVEGVEYKCYMEEYAIFEMVQNYDENFASEVYEHLGRMASEYSGVELMRQPSMWTIIKLHPLDVDMDEKQGNLNVLCNTLRGKGFGSLAEQMQAVNTECRDKIEKVFEKLPKCVYQGDLNPTNLLQDENGHFAGLIDFNMAGTEVNINCFLNETMYQLEEADFKELTAEEIYEKMYFTQKRRMAIILETYKMDEVENSCFDSYRKIIFMSLYPNVMCLKYFLDKDIYVDKVIKLLKRICV